MEFDVRRLLGEEDEVKSAAVKTYDSFIDYFEDAVRVEAVTYSDSPTFLLKVFETLPSIETIRVLVGRRSLEDYREQLSGKVDVADKLESLKSRGQLEIHLTKRKDVHSKLYRVTTTDDRIRWVDGSANFSAHGWEQQANSLTIYETHAGSPLDKKFQQKLDWHFSYGNPFMEDLREQLEEADEDRDSVLNLWVQGELKTRRPVSEFNKKMFDELDQKVPEAATLVIDAENAPGLKTELEKNDYTVSLDEPETVEVAGDMDADDPVTAEVDDENTYNITPQETRINLSLRNLPDKDQETTIGNAQKADIPLSGEILQPNLASAERYHEYVYGIPPMRVVKTDAGKEQLVFHHDGVKYDLASPLPDEPEWVDAALSSLERYFDTIDKYGNPSGDPDEVKAHMFEALLWMFWAPLATRQAEFLQQQGITGGDLDKLLPFLFIYGPSNAGKGMFSRYALSLISKGTVISAVDADEVGQRRLRHAQTSQSTFPLLADDITKAKINNLDCLRNWWSEWGPGDRFPMFGAISNDRRPKDWFRNRAKILRFEVLFEPSTAGTAAVNRLVSEYNPIYEWFVGEYLSIPLSLRDDDDALAEVRQAMLNLYEYADRDVPAYFPTQPAEELYDLGCGRWQEALERGTLTFKRSNEKLFAEFSRDMETYHVKEFQRDVPAHINTSWTGYEIQIGDEDEFEAWLGRPLTKPNRGVLSRLIHRDSN